MRLGAGRAGERRSLLTVTENTYWLFAALDLPDGADVLDRLTCWAENRQQVTWLHASYLDATHSASRNAEATLLAMGIDRARFEAWTASAMPTAYVADDERVHPKVWKEGLDAEEILEAWARERAPDGESLPWRVWRVGLRRSALLSALDDPGLRAVALPRIDPGAHPRTAEIPHRTPI